MLQNNRTNIFTYTKLYFVSWTPVMTIKQNSCFDKYMLQKNKTNIFILYQLKIAPFKEIDFLKSVGGP